MQTPGAENAMLKKRGADCTGDRRSVAGRRPLFLDVVVRERRKGTHFVWPRVRLCMEDRTMKVMPGSLTVAQVQPRHV
jgi:hypothetical protein